MKAQAEHIQLFNLIAAFWMLLYLTTVLLVMAFGELGTYQQFVYSSSLLGLTIGCAGLSSRALSIREKLSPTGLNLTCLLLGLVFLTIIGSTCYGYPNPLATSLSEVLPDNSLGIYKSVFLKTEVGKQFGVPIFVFLLFSWLVIAFIPLGQELSKQCSKLTAQAATVVISISTVSAWIIASIASAIPYGLLGLAALLTAAMFFRNDNKKNVSILASLLLVLATSSCLLMPSSGINGGTLFKNIPLVKSMLNFSQRSDFYPLLAGNAVKAIAAEVNHQFIGIAFSTDITKRDLTLLKDKFESLKPLEIDDFDLPYHLITNPKECNLLIVGPYPAASLLAAIKFGFTNITIVSRRDSDLEPVRLLMGAKEASKYNFVVKDGFKFFRQTDQKYDLINFTGRYDKQSINSLSILGFDDTLYSYSSFSAARKLLTKDGYIAVPYGFGFPVLNKLAKTMKRSVGHFVLHFAARGGGYILAASKDSKLKIDKERLSSLKETFGPQAIKDPKALEDKRQLRSKASWTLNSPFLQGFNSVLDMGHLSLLTIFSIIAIFSIRWLGPLQFLTERDNYLLAFLTAAFTCLLGKAVTVFSLWNGTTDFNLAFNQIIPWLPLAYTLPLIKFSKFLPLNVVLFPAIFLIGIGKLGLIASKGYWYSNLPTTFIMQLIPITCISVVLVLVLSKSSMISNSISSMFLGFSFGFIFTLGAYFGGLTQLDSIILILMIASFITIKGRSKQVAIQ